MLQSLTGVWDFPTVLLWFPASSTSSAWAVQPVCAGVCTWGGASRACGAGFVSWWLEGRPSLGHRRHVRSSSINAHFQIKHPLLLPALRGWHPGGKQANCPARMSPRAKGTTDQMKKPPGSVPRAGTLCQVCVTVWVPKFHTSAAGWGKHPIGFRGCCPCKALPQDSPQIPDTDTCSARCKPFQVFLAGGEGAP